MHFHVLVLSTLIWSPCSCRISGAGKQTWGGHLGLHSHPQCPRAILQSQGKRDGRGPISGVKGEYLAQGVGVASSISAGPELGSNNTKAGGEGGAYPLPCPVLALHTGTPCDAPQPSEEEDVQFYR